MRKPRAPQAEAGEAGAPLGACSDRTAGRDNLAAKSQAGFSAALSPRSPTLTLSPKSSVDSEARSLAGSQLDVVC